MRKVFLPVLVASAFALGALCAPALAQTDSAVDEYQESIPGAGGGPSSNEGGQGGGSGGSGGGSDSATGPVGGGGASLAPQVADELADEGSAGAGLGNFTEQTGTAPASAQGSSTGDGPGDGGSSSTGPAPSSSDDEGFFGALGNVLGTFLLGSGSDSAGSSGLGVFFPIVLIGALAGTAALLIARRRRGVAEPHQG